MRLTKAIFLPGNKRVEFRALEVRRPGAGDVLIAVKASCICRNDLSLYHGKPVVRDDTGWLGRWVSRHEPAGVIAETGSGVKAFRPGDRVAFYLGVGCGVCTYCRAGNFHLCGTRRCLGSTSDGGNAEYLVVPERNCLRIPDAMSYVAAAISTDGFGTLYSVCKKLNVSGA